MDIFGITYITNGWTVFAHSLDRPLWSRAALSTRVEEFGVAAADQPILDRERQHELDFVLGDGAMAVHEFDYAAGVAEEAFPVSGVNFAHTHHLHGGARGHQHGAEHVGEFPGAHGRACRGDELGVWGEGLEDLLQIPGVQRVDVRGDYRVIGIRAGWLIHHQ